MISSLPKPVQNDFDTVVIDLLTKYSLDNKSVQRFVQTVAQQVSSINRLPRTLQANKTSTSRNVTDKEKVEPDKTKPNFLTRLENLQNTFNKGGLLGVFFEYIKNRQANAQAKIADTKFAESQQKPYQQIDNQNIVPVKQESTIIENKETTQIQKSQEVFDGNGLLNVVKNILNILKDQLNQTAEPKPIKAINDTILPTVATKTYNIENQNTDFNTNINPLKNTNYTTVNASNAQSVNNETTSITDEGIQAQKQNLLTGEKVVILGGINREGKEDLTAVLKSVLKDFKPFDIKKQEQVTQQQVAGAEAGGGLLSLAADLIILKSVFARLLPMIGGFATGLMRAVPVLTLMVSAGKGLYELATQGREKYVEGKKEEYFTEDGELKGSYLGSVASAVIDPIGAGAAVIGGFEDASKMKAEAEERTIIAESKLQTTQLNKNAAMKKAGFQDMESFDASLYGYTNVEDFKKARIEGKLDYSKQKDWRDYLKQKPTAPKVQPVQTAPLSKKVETTTPASSSPLKTEQSNQTFNEIILPPPKPIDQPWSRTPVKPTPLKEGGLVTKPTLANIAEEEPEFVIPWKDFSIHPNNTISLTPDAVKATPPLPTSITETHITNNNIDKQILGDIASNTEKTNKTLLSLSDAIFNLAKTINTGKQANNNFVINNGQQAQTYTSTSEMAAHNFDTIRAVRQQFLAATV